MTHDVPRDLVLEQVEGRYAVCRLDPDAEVPGWARPEPGGLVSITRTDRELSLIVPQELVPPGVTAERGWVVLRVAGTLDFGLVGVLARLTAALADATVPVFVVSTYETDLILVAESQAANAAAALRTVARTPDLA